MNKERLIELLKKKKQSGQEVSGVEKDAKLNAVKDLQGYAKDMLSGNLKGLKKVTVASNSPEGLEAGLEKAKDVVEEMPEHEDEEHEDMEDPMSVEEIDAKIAELEAKKAQLTSLEE
jgi:hypothetical protein